MKRYGFWVEDVPTNATGPNVPGTGDDDSTVIVRKKPKIFRRKRRLSKEKIEEGIASRAAQIAKDKAKQKGKELKKKAVGAVKSKLKSTGPYRAFAGAKSKVKAAQDALDKAKEKKKKIGATWKKLKGEETEDDMVERNYAKERENYHSKPEEMERNAARSKARRLMIKNGKAARGDGKDVHHKDNDPLNNEEDNLKMTTQAWNRREPRLRKEESINIDERELTSTELKRREEIAKDLDDSKFKEKYGDKWKQVKMGVATNMAKKESIEEADDPKADKAKAKELKIAKAIAQAQLAIAKEQERVQKLTDLQNKVKDQQTEETTMSKKYLNTKQGSIEDAVKQVWQNAARASQAAAPPRVENKKVEEEEVQPDKKSSKVDGRSKSYKETLKRIALRKEKLAAMKKSSKKVEHVTDAIEEEDDLDEAKFAPALIKKAIKVAYDMEGDMTGAHKKIEKMKRGLADDPTVKTALQDANEETIHEKVTGYFDSDDPAWMKKSTKKHGIKAKMSHKNVNPGYDEWELVAKDEKTLYKWYRDGYSDDDDYEDFKDTHLESRQHHRNMMTEAVTGYWTSDDAAWIKKSTKKYGIKVTLHQKNVNQPGDHEWKLVAKDEKTLWKWHRGEYSDDDDYEDFKDTHLESRQHHRNMMTEGSKEEYQKFFKAALKKFGATSPADMDDEKKKKFFDYIDKNWTKEEQQDFSEGTLPPALKKAIAAKKAKNGDTEDEDKDPVGKKESWKKDKKEEIKEVATVDYEFTDARGAKAANAFARMWVPKGRRGDDYDEDEFETEIFGKDKNELSVDSGEDGDMDTLHKMILKRYKSQLKGHDVTAESFIREAKSPMDELRKIVDKKQHGKVSGMKVDLFSASAMVKVFDALNPGNQKKVEQMLKSKNGVATFAEFAMSNVKR
jgi:hypothetical protein